MRYVITGATGEIGSRVAHMLIDRGERPRLLVRNLDKAKQQFGDAAEIVAGDLADPLNLQSAFAGFDSLFLVNIGPTIPERDALAAQAALAAGITHVVKLSSMDADQHLAIGAWHERGERAIRASGVPFTFIQPSGFMSNLLAWADAVRTEGVIRLSTGAGKRPFIHSDDIAAVVTESLVSRAYIGQSLPITGPAALSFQQIAAILAAAVGRPVEFQAISDQEARDLYAATGASHEETEAHVALWQAIREGRLAAVTQTIQNVLRRAPIPLSIWARENAAAFR